MDDLVYLVEQEDKHMCMHLVQCDKDYPGAQAYIKLETITCPNCGYTELLSTDRFCPECLECNS